MAEEPEAQETPESTEEVTQTVDGENFIDMLADAEETPPGTEPAPEGEPTAEGEVTPEPAPAPASAEEPKAEAQGGDYDKLKAENDALQSELANNKLIADIVFSRKDLSDAVIEAATQTPGTAPPPQQAEAPAIEIPKAPEYVNLDEINDPESGTAKWFTGLLNNVREQTREETLSQVDQRVEQRFQEERNSNARQRAVEKSFTDAQQRNEASDDDMVEFTEWVQDPDISQDERLDMAYKAWKVRKDGNGEITPQPPPPSPPPPAPPQQREAPRGLPLYTETGGAAEETITDENDAHNEALLKNHKKFNQGI